ncbi:MAG: hypothetical protein CVU28_06105, partial [Betaproteobacteria bacterium HGW-Betaproteobacteria-21]
AQLVAGMVLAQDLMHADGYLLLSRGFIIDEPIIDQLLRLERTEGRLIIICIAQPPASERS